MLLLLALAVPAMAEAVDESSLEPNNKKEEAKLLQKGRHSNLTISKKDHNDWFKVYVPGNSVINILVESNNDDLDLIVRLDDNRAPIRSIRSRNSRAHIQEPVHDEQYLYIKVKGRKAKKWKKKDVVTYTITIDVLESRYTCDINRWPKGWEDMELESKWEANMEQFNALEDALEDGEEIFGLKMKVRWDGLSRRFQDVYYDTPNGDLTAAGHVLRHRHQWDWDAPGSEPPSDNSLQELLTAKSWEEQWQRLQYKSTPKRIDALWFRSEKGDCRAWDINDEGLCDTGRKFNIDDVWAGQWNQHDAIQALLDDHPNLDLSTMKMSRFVNDFRYRIEFLGDEDELLYEMSMDRLQSIDYRTGQTTESVEIELEILKPDYGADEVFELQILSDRFQNAFGLTPSAHSKGGSGVTNICSRHVVEEDR